MREIQEFSLDELSHLLSPRAITGDTVVLNMGPQHPSTHGVLRLIVELDGEIVQNVIPDVGYLHTGIEKNMEAKILHKAEVDDRPHGLHVHHRQQPGVLPGC